jgi:hypothetical protein
MSLAFPDGFRDCLNAFSEPDRAYAGSVHAHNADALLDGISKTVATRIFANSCLGKVRKQRARCRQSRVEAASVFH